jgi:hypothetical protein
MADEAMSWSIETANRRLLEALQNFGMADRGDCYSQRNADTHRCTQSRANWLSVDIIESWLGDAP